MRRALEFVRNEPVLALLGAIVGLGLLILVLVAAAFSFGAVTVKLDMPPAEQAQ